MPQRSISQRRAILINGDQSIRESRMVMFSPKNLMKRTKSRSIRKQKDIYLIIESIRRVKTAHANRTQIHHTLYLSHKVTLYLCRFPCQYILHTLHCLTSNASVYQFRVQGVWGCFQGICQEVAANFLMLVNLSETVHIFITLISPFVVE